MINKIISGRLALKQAKITFNPTCSLTLMAFKKSCSRQLKISHLQIAWTRPKAKNKFKLLRNNLKALCYSKTSKKTNLFLSGLKMKKLLKELSNSSRIYRKGKLLLAKEPSIILRQIKQEITLLLILLLLFSLLHKINS